jgi:hypothetical protein
VALRKSIGGIILQLCGQSSAAQKYTCQIEIRWGSVGNPTDPHLEIILVEFFPVLDYSLGSNPWYFPTVRQVFHAVQTASSLITGSDTLDLHPWREGTMEPYEIEEFWDDLLAFIGHRRVILVAGAELLTTVSSTIPVLGRC